MIDQDSMLKTIGEQTVLLRLAEQREAQFVHRIGRLEIEKGILMEKLKENGIYVDLDNIITEGAGSGN